MSPTGPASDNYSKTTAELQSPTGYTGIYENWDITQTWEESGTEYHLWVLCTPSEYPVLYLDFDGDGVPQVSYSDGYLNQDSYQTPCSFSITEDVEPTDTETPDVEPTDTETPDVEPTDTETPDVEATNTETPDVLEAPLQVYPNPATTNALYIRPVLQATSPLQGGDRTYTYTIYTEGGRLLLSGSFVIGHHIDISSLVGGRRYVIIIQDDSGSEELRIPLLIRR